MRTAPDWKDYELLDATDGERLERWGGYVLVRPDPQVVWQTGRDHPLWEKADAVYHRSSSGGGQWEFRRKLPESWTIRWRDLSLYVTPTSFKHTGVFPEQAANWTVYQDLIRKSGRPIRVLNLFGYTGAATLACLKAGASVCHVDASKGMVNQARKNAELSGLSDRPCRWIVDDCVKFVEREARRGSRYDGIIMDPPSYGRGPTGQVWKIEEALYPLVKACAGILTEEPLFFAINSYTAGLSPAAAGYVLASCMKGHEGEVDCDEIGLRVTSTGLTLPCGSTALYHHGSI